MFLHKNRNWSSDSLGQNYELVSVFKKCYECYDLKHVYEEIYHFLFVFTFYYSCKLSLFLSFGGGAFLFWFGRNHLCLIREGMFCQDEGWSDCFITQRGCLSRFPGEGPSCSGISSRSLFCFDYQYKRAEAQKEHGDHFYKSQEGRTQQQETHVLFIQVFFYSGHSYKSSFIPDFQFQILTTSIYLFFTFTADILEWVRMVRKSCVFTAWRSGGKWCWKHG